MSKDKDREELVKAICEAVKSVPDYTTLQLIYIVVQQVK